MPDLLEFEEPIGILLKEIEALWEVMTKHRGDRPVAVEVEMNGGSRHVIVRAEVTHSIRVRTSEQFVADVERLCGVGSVTIHS